MSPMRHFSIIAGALASVLVFAGAASAQIIPPTGSVTVMPPPVAPLPGPTNGAWQAPSVAAPAPTANVTVPRPSFSDRISNCLDQGAAAGLGPNDRATYSRSCANQ
jgi:hypothetical protein